MNPFADVAFKDAAVSTGIALAIVLLLIFIAWMAWAVITTPLPPAFATLQIRDARTSQPIPSATVILGGSNPATFRADEHGTVSIDFQGKTQWLTVTAKGYKDTKYRLTGSGRIALFIHPDEGPAEAIPCWDLE